MWNRRIIAVLKKLLATVFFMHVDEYRPKKYKKHEEEKRKKVEGEILYVKIHIKKTNQNKKKRIYWRANRFPFNFSLLLALFSPSFNSIFFFTKKNNNDEFMNWSNFFCETAATLGRMVKNKEKKENENRLIGKMFFLLVTRTGIERLAESDGTKCVLAVKLFFYFIFRWPAHARDTGWDAKWYFEKGSSIISLSSHSEVC